MILLQVMKRGNMMALNNISYSYAELIADFGQEKLEQRYKVIYDYMKSFIERKEYTDKVRISTGLLNQMIVDYFTDMHRLKEFHDIEYANYIKIHAYSAYWLLKNGIARPKGGIVLLPMMVILIKARPLSQTPQMKSTALHTTKRRISALTKQPWMKS